MQIACLHTADSNVDIFEEAAADLGLSPHMLQHSVRADLLFNVEQAGSLTPSIIAATHEAIRTVGENADIVILNCSTLGPALDSYEGMERVIRVDHALAEMAAQQTGLVAVLCTAPTTVEPTTELFQALATSSAATIELILIEGAWDAFRAGSLTDYSRLISEAAEQAYQQGAVQVVFAQASMAEAAILVRNGPLPLTSPISGLKAAMLMLSER